MERVNYGQRLPLFAAIASAFAADVERFVAGTEASVARLMRQGDLGVPGPTTKIGKSWPCAESLPSCSRHF
jgi:hypothetical protein